MTDRPRKLGFIGLGLMGTPMAGHLIAAGHQLFVHARGRMPDAIALSSATQCTSARGVAERADIVFLMAPDTPDGERALFAENGVAAGLTKGKVVVDMSAVPPLATKDFARRVREIGCEYLAPSSARALGVALPDTASAQELFNACAAHGGKGWDHSAMVRALETLADFEVAQKAA